MLRVNIYIRESVDRDIALLAGLMKRSKAEVVRSALDEGMRLIRPKSLTARRLISLSEEAEKIPTKGLVPKDLIKNLDYYTWGGRKRG